MLLQEAMEALKAGEVLCREVWTLADGYLKLMPGMSHVWKIILEPSPNAGNYIFSFEDLNAADWKKFAMPEKCIDATTAEAA